MVDPTIHPETTVFYQRRRCSGIMAEKPVSFQPVRDRIRCRQNGWSGCPSPATA